MVLTQIKNFDFVGDVKPEKYFVVGTIINYNIPSGEKGYENEFESNIYEDKIQGDIVQAKNDIDNLIHAILDHKHTTCNVCNHRIKRGVIFQHNENNSLCFVGGDCAQSIFKYKLDIAGAKKQTLKERKRRDKINKINAVLDTNPGLQEALEINNFIIRKIAVEFYSKYATLSDKQISLVFKIQKERLEYENNSEKVVDGRIKDMQLKVESLSIKCVERISRYSGTSKDYFIYVLMVSDKGWKVWGKLGETSKIFNKRITNVSDVENIIKKGDVKTVTATITPSAKDPYFGIMKRVKIVL